MKEERFAGKQNSAGEMGHRIAKHSYDKDQAYNNGLGQLVKSTYYVLDAQGNTMATYERAVDENTLQISYAQIEKFIYGSSRLGVQNCNIALLGSQNNSYTQTTVPHRIGKKGYELSNHLGNVLSVFSDKVIPHSNGSTIDYWQADILQSSDYSPFGVILEGRDLKLAGSNVPYDFGYNGMEIDKEMSGNGNSYTTEFRQYDPRLGRWKSLDPLAHLLTDQSPYSFALNSPIRVVDRDGQFPILINGQADDFSEASSWYWKSIISTVEKYTGYKMGDQVKGPQQSQWSGDFLFVNGDRGTLAGTRRDAGILQAKLDADAIWAKMKETMKDGKITEQIQMISHSKGVAFSEGYIEEITKQIQAKAEAEGIGFGYDESSIVQYNIGLAPHQSNSLDAHGTTSVYVSHDMDALSGDDATGRVLNISSSAPSSQNGLYDSHQVPSFKREISFILNVLENNGSKYQGRIKSWYELYDKNTGTSTEFTTGSENEEGCEFSYTTN
jgi:RHS repeat-associated protein